MSLESRVDQLERAAEPRERIYNILEEVRAREPNVFRNEGEMDLTLLTDDELIRLDAAYRGL